MKFNLAYTVIALTLTTVASVANVTTTTAEIDEVLEKEKEIMAALSSLQAEDKQLDVTTTMVTAAATPSSEPTAQYLTKREIHHQHILDAKTGKATAAVGEESSTTGGSSSNTMSMMEGRGAVMSAKAGKSSGYHGEVHTTMSMMEGMITTNTTTTMTTTTTTKAAKARESEQVGGAAKTAKDMSIAFKNNKEAHHDAKASKTMSITTTTTATVVGLGGKSSKIDEEQEHMLSMYQSATNTLLSMGYYAKSSKGTSDTTRTDPTEPMDNQIFTEAPGVNDLDSGSAGVENGPRDSSSSSSSLSKFEEEVAEAMISGSTAVISSPVHHHTTDLKDKPLANGGTENALKMASSGASSLVSSSYYAVVGMCLVGSAIVYAIMV